MTLELILIRSSTVYPAAGEPYTLGTLYANGMPFGYTVEDEVRPFGAKVYGRTAIPSGSYRVENSYSPRFKKILPAVLDVPGFSGIRIHGGNKSEDSLGCIILGAVRTKDGVAQCKDIVQRLIRRIAESNQTTLIIKGASS